MKLFEKPLFIFEMANNHMGSLKHGLRIINEFAQVKKGFENEFSFAFKFQFRHFDTFIHPDFKERMDLKYIKRFSETKLTDDEFRIMKKELEKFQFYSMCTPFDEKSVDLIEEMDFDIIKIASCSLTDWPLLERIVTTQKPVIASTAGSDLISIDNVVSFFQHRDKNLSLMHCVGEYPTTPENLQLNQIDLLQNRYSGVNIGFSTHEHPDNLESIKIVVAKGVKIYEKHVAVVTDEFAKNEYSATPEQIHKWLLSARETYTMCGVENKRATFSEKEIADLRQFKRGVFARNDIKKGEVIEMSNTFFAFPNIPKQLLSNDMSKYTQFIAKTDINLNQPIFETGVEKVEEREKIYEIVQKVKDILLKGRIIFPGKADLEISHHYGIEKFYEFGTTMITVVNRDYCKKLIILLPGQNHPEQYHSKKEETFMILHGSIKVTLDGVMQTYYPGDIVTVKPGVKHAFKTEEGTVFEEISSTHYIDDSFYTDMSIQNNKKRKTILSYWLD
jgi:sialic acid synthase SpsE/quercetin dioxygenase-like cupin family protein